MFVASVPPATQACFLQECVCQNMRPRQSMTILVPGQPVNDIKPARTRSGANESRPMAISTLVRTCAMAAASIVCGLGGAWKVVESSMSGAMHLPAA